MGAVMGRPGTGTTHPGARIGRTGARAVGPGTDKRRLVNPGASASANAAERNWCRGRLGRHELPRRFDICDALPRNASRKILKRELRRTGEAERRVSFRA